MRISSWRLSLFGCTFLVLMGIFAFLFYSTQAVDIEAQNQVIIDLRVLKQLDAEWNANILRSRIGLNNDYDPVTAPLRVVRQLQERLQKALHLTRGNHIGIVLERFNKSWLEKGDLVERFKSQNAILKNSLIYFPIATEDFRSMLHERAKSAGNENLIGLESEVSMLLADTLRFNLVPDADLGTHIKARLEQLNARSYPPETAAALEQLGRHVHTILRQRVLEDALLARLTATPTERSIDELITAFDQDFDAILAEKQKYRSYLVVYSAFLLVLLGYAGWRIMKSYQVIAHVNRRLRAANESLERRVAERTAELEKQSAQLAELATHDALTGLINGGQFMNQLGRALLRAERRSSVVVVMFIDLDGFKAVNDTYGHATGDLVLKEVGARVPTHLRQEDVFARLGGDEFVVLLEDVKSREGAERVAEVVLAQIETITSAGGHPVKISASIGISSAQGRFGVTYSATALLDEADHAMYQAKQNGKGRIAFSDNSQWGIKGEMDVKMDVKQTT
jgi:diguanylate cyclase (GGDEF)-like protein